jgi:hypothetical protein
LRPCSRKRTSRCPASCRTCSVAVPAAAAGAGGRRNQSGRRCDTRDRAPACHATPGCGPSRRRSRGSHTGACGRLSGTARSMTYPRREHVRRDRTPERWGPHAPERRSHVHAPRVRQRGGNRHFKERAELPRVQGKLARTVRLDPTTDREAAPQPYPSTLRRQRGSGFGGFVTRS